MAIKERRVSTVGRIMNFSVSGYVYFVAFTLVLFMISTLVTGVFSTLIELFELATSKSGIFDSGSRTQLELNLLHTIAFTIVLVKAYKILISYAETQHINLKFLVEIAIIAPTIELIFNTESYEFFTLVLFAGFAVLNLVVYLFFYKTLKNVSKDYQKESHI